MSIAAMPVSDPKKAVGVPGGVVDAGAGRNEYWGLPICKVRDRKTAVAMVNYLFDLAEKGVMPPQGFAIADSRMFENTVDKAEEEGSAAP